MAARLSQVPSSQKRQGRKHHSLIYRFKHVRPFLNGGGLGDKTDFKIRENVLVLDSLTVVVLNSHQAESIITDREVLPGHIATVDESRHVNHNQIASGVV